MKRSLGRKWGWAACALAVLLPGSGAVWAQQAPEQHWQATPNYPPNYPPNYQPSPAQNAPPAAGNPAGGTPATGQYQNPPQPDQPVGPPQYPTLDHRQPVGAGQPIYGPPPPDNRAAYPQQDPRTQGQQGPGQPVAAQPIQGPPVPTGPPQAPFVLSPPEVAALENLLSDWEKRNKEIRVLESKFFRWKYDAVFQKPNQPPPAEEGELKFAAPDKGLMKIEVKDHPEASEQWMCDGKSIYQFDYSKKLVTEHVLPPELQGKGIGDGPLPFVFGIEAQKLKQRYFMRIITPPNVQNQVWLEAFPRYQQQAAEFSKVQVILQIAGSSRALLPFAIQIFLPNGKDRTVYQLQNPTVNPAMPMWGGIFGNWTKVSIPIGWMKKTELPQPPIEARLNPSLPPQR